MSEISDNGENREPTQGEFERQFRMEHNPLPLGIGTYYSEHIQRIVSGERVWMVRNFESEGRCYDYWIDKRQVAQLLEGGWDGYAFETYFEDHSGVHETLEEAIDTVETHFHEPN